MPKPPKKKSYRSPLENHPKYVHAIGMISIENASLESMLGELLGALLGIHLSIGHTLYFTPRAAIPRLELLSNVAAQSIGRHPKLLARVRAIIKRSKAAMGKRHDIIHSLWAETEYGEATGVARISFPEWGGGDVPLTVLNELIRDFRILVEEVGPLINEVQQARGVGFRPLLPGYAIARKT